MIGLYRAMVGLLRVLTPLAAHGQSKWARGLRARRRGGLRLIEWGRKRRDPARPTVWFHASSVGEMLQAKAVAGRLSAMRADLQVVFTYFSPSAEVAAAAFGALEWDALPWDAAGPVDAVVSAVQPDLVVFTQREVWPVLTATVTSRGGRVALIAGTLPEGAGRLRGLARSTMASAMSCVSLVGAIAQPDAERFLQLGTPREAVVVTGDPGIDSALERLNTTSADEQLLKPFRASVPTVVAGSTWPEDESVLCPALDAYRSEGGALRVIIAPHEPSPTAVAQLSRRLAAGGWVTSTLAEVEAQGRPVASGQAVVVERLGVLASLYRVATLAYVGGGLGSSGLHSVLEPAAAGAPVVFGPRGHSGAAEALLLAGGAREVGDTRALTRVMNEWLVEGEVRDSAGASARDYIDQRSGAAERSAELLEALLKTE